MLSTGMSFEEALRAADKGTNRMFGFDELGMFGRMSASALPSSGTRPAVPPDESGGEADSGAPPPGRTATTACAQAETLQSGPQAAGDRASEAAAPRPAPSAPADDSGLPFAASAFSAGGSAPVTDSRRATPAVGEAASAPAALLARVPRQAPPPAAARLTLIVEQGQARLVARDFSFTEDDRALLEERVDALLEAHGLTKAELMLNGSDGGVRRADGKEG